ncbi:MAG: hypothetical protein J6A89_03900 [Clostridia bacterium]|nr:hypothetical protein [Clostridia bacterium]
MDNKKKITIIIIIIIILLIIFAILLISLKPQTQISQNNMVEETPIDYYNEYHTQRATEGVTADSAVASLEDNVNQYFTVKSIIDNFNTYVSYLNANISNLGLIVPEGQEQEALSEYRQEGLKYINDMLAENYKLKYSTSNDFLYKLLKDFANQNYEITNMYKVEDSSYINTYFIYGNYSGTEFNYIVILDKYNYTFEIYLNNYVKDNGYLKNDISTMKTLHIEKIDKNENNTFQYKNINSEEMATVYYNDYLNKMKTNPQNAYKLLDFEYSKNRFENISDFQNYISEVISNEPDRIMVKFNITKYDNYTEYICTDNLGNNFIFKVDGVMNYTAILDTYTVPIESYEKEYNEDDDTKKAQLCLNRFFEALNNKDYEKAYSYLNETYRKNNFVTVDDFKSYVQTNWFSYSSFTYSNVELNNENYVLSGTLNDIKTDGSYDAEHIDKTFILRLGTNIRDFQISFEK